MALVDHILVSAAFFDGATIVEITVPIDDSEIDVEGVPFPNAQFQGDIVGTIIGPGSFDVEVWRKDHHSDGKNPWRDSLSLFPNGISEDDSPVTYTPGGPVRDLGDLDTIQLSARGQ